MRSLSFLCSVMVVALGATACTDVSRGLGFEKNVPDEFRVVTRPPLTLPPDYDLRPPGAKEGRTSDDAKTRARAAGVLLGSKNAEGTGQRDMAEHVLLRKAGIESADPNIRRELSSGEAEEKDGFWAKLKAGELLVDKGGDEGEALNAAEELERLRTSHEHGDEGDDASDDEDADDEADDEIDAGDDGE